VFAIAQQSISTTRYKRRPIDHHDNITGDSSYHSSQTNIDSRIPTRGGTSYEKLGAQKIFAAAPTIPVCPHLLGALAFFCPPVEAMHAVTIMSLKAIAYNYLYRHCVDQQIYSLVFTEFQSDHRSDAIKKWEGKGLFSTPCIEIWRGIRPPCPTACSTPETYYCFIYGMQPPPPAVRKEEPNTASRTFLNV